MSLVMQYFLTLQVPGEPQASRAKPVSTNVKFNRSLSFMVHVSRGVALWDAQE